MKLTQIIMTMAALTGTAFGSNVRKTKQRANVENKIRHLETSHCMDVDDDKRVILVDCGTAPKWIVIGNQHIQIAEFGHEFEGECLSLDSSDDAIVENCNNKDVHRWYAEQVYDKEKQYRIRNADRSLYLEDDNGNPNFVVAKEDNPNLFDQRWQLPVNFW